MNKKDFTVYIEKQLEGMSLDKQIKVLQKIQNYICNSCNVSFTTIAGTPNSFAKRIHWSGKNVVTKIMSYLYKDATIYLERKHNKYLELTGNSAE